MPEDSNTINFIEFPAGSEGEIVKVKAFYSDVFNWGFTDWSNHYADTSSSGLRSGFNASPEHGPQNPLAVIYVRDLEAARHKVVDAGGSITKDIFAFPGGERFHFKDPSANELAVWSDEEHYGYA